MTPTFINSPPSTTTGEMQCLPVIMTPTTKGRTIPEDLEDWRSISEEYSDSKIGVESYPIATFRREQLHAHIGFLKPRGRCQNHPR